MGAVPVLVRQRARPVAASSSVTLRSGTTTTASPRAHGASRLMSSATQTTSAAGREASGLRSSSGAVPGPPVVPTARHHWRTGGDGFGASAPGASSQGEGRAHGRPPRPSSVS